ncbi:MAG: hypothetical protein J5529_04855 [Prevotella sp.]|nr:hypothetical protein [Prevotella sp.]
MRILRYLFTIHTVMTVCAIFAQPQQPSKTKNQSSGDIIHIISCADIDKKGEEQIVIDNHSFFTQTLADSINLNTTFTAVANEFTKEKADRDFISARIANMKTAANDVIMFYFCGKGATVPNDSLPLLFLGSDSVAVKEGKVMFLSDILSVLLAKPHRLLVVICESGREDVAADSLGFVILDRISDNRYSDLTNYSFRGKTSKNAWQNLFSQKGNYILMACQPGQNNNHSLPYTLSYYLSNTFMNLCYRRNCLWSDLLDDCVSRANGINASSGIHQTSYWFDIKQINKKDIEK